MKRRVFLAGCLAAAVVFPLLCRDGEGLTGFLPAVEPANATFPPK